VDVVVILNSSQKVIATVHDLAGNPVKTLADKTFTAGTHSLTWDGKSRRGRSVVQDVYFIVVTVNGTREVFKVLVVK
jgi:flagellar hook assembly protein FlgD